MSLGSVHPCTCTEECGCEGVPTVAPCPAEQVPNVSFKGFTYVRVHFLSGEVFLYNSIIQEN